MHAAVEATSKGALGRGMQGLVLLNRAHHLAARRERDAWAVDDCSSGAWFDGWAWEPYDQRVGTDAPVAAAQTRLLRRGWRRGGGWIDPREVPAG